MKLWRRSAAVDAGECIEEEENKSDLSVLQI